MTLLTRLGRLFRADLNAVLDGLEEPAALLKQAIRDMEEALAGEEAEHARLDQEATRLTQAKVDAHARAAQLSEELSLCLDAGKDELARGLVRRKLENAQHASALAARLTILHDSAQTLTARVVEQRRQLDTLRQRAALTPVASAAVDEGTASPWQTAPVVSDAEVEVALLREKQRRTPT